MARAYHLEVYGCQMNAADGELIRGLLEADGWERAASVEEADLIVINTCGVRERAAERVIGHVRSLRPLKRRHPGLRIALVGCLARYGGGDLVRRLPEVDHFLGPDAYRGLPGLLRAEEGPRPHVATGLVPEEMYAGVRPRRAGGVNAWLSIMRGCDRMCSYCMVPFARGRERSRPAAEVVREAREVAAEGFRSVTLLGQTVTSYRDGAHDFAGLLAALGEIDGIDRIRFLSPHPADFDDRLLDAMAHQPKVCRHVHLPLQSGSDRVLAAMCRGYTRDGYLGLIARLRARMPGIAITTDLIVGFPGERAEDLAATLDLMCQVQFDQAFMFAYSPRPGTYAARFLEDDVSAEEKRRRLEEVIRLQEAHARARCAAHVGRDLAVLVESPAREPAGCWFGRSDDFKDVIFASGDGDPPRCGDLIDVHIERATSHTLLGTRVRDREAR
jgi:tRNA-2-methylthio-N6-dimethylallyladenosine synthase